MTILSPHHRVYWKQFDFRRAKVFSVANLKYLENNMLRAIDIWKRLDKSCAIRYRCFQVIPNGGYFVQSTDYYHLPLKESDLRFVDAQFIELIIEDPLGSDKKTYSSIEEAIEMHRRIFSEDDEE